MYKNIFQRSWRITRQHMLLWVFGLFVLFLGGKGIDFELFFTNADTLKNPSSPFHPAFWDFSRWQAVFEQSVGPWWLLVVLLIILLALFVFVLMMISQIGLVDAFSRYSLHPELSHPYTFQDAVSASKRHIGTVTVLNIISRGVVYGLLALAALPFFFASTEGNAILYSFLLYVVVTPLTIVISLLTKYALNYAVLHHTPVGISLLKGWELFRNNIGVSLEMAIGMSVAYFAVNLSALFLAVVVTLPILLIGILEILFFESLMMVTIYAQALTIVTLAAVIASAVLFSAWHFGNWTLLFLELTKENKRSKIHRLFKREQ